MIHKQKTASDRIPEWISPAWEEFFKTEEAKQPLHWESIFDSRLFPMQRKDEVRDVLHLVQSREICTVCEIGAARGSGLYIWLKCLSNLERVIASDICPITYSNQFETNFPDKKFYWMERGSRDQEDFLGLLEWLDGGKIDLLFIDGDKNKMVQDFNAYLPLMSPGGIVLVHDINCKQGGSPKKAFIRICSRGYKFQRIIDTGESKWAVQRERKGIASSGPYENWLRFWNSRSAGVGVIWLEN